MSAPAFLPQFGQPAIEPATLGAWPSVSVSVGVVPPPSVTVGFLPPSRLGEPPEAKSS